MSFAQPEQHFYVLLLILALTQIQQVVKVSCQPVAATLEELENRRSPKMTSHAERRCTHDKSSAASTPGLRKRLYQWAPGFPQNLFSEGGARNRPAMGDFRCAMAAST